jgi:hypothetical protein
MHALEIGYDLGGNPDNGKIAVIAYSSSISVSLILFSHQSDAEYALASLSSFVCGCWDSEWAPLPLSQLWKRRNVEAAMPFY